MNFPDIFHIILGTVECVHNSFIYNLAFFIVDVYCQN